MSKQRHKRGQLGLSVRHAIGFLASVATLSAADTHAGQVFPKVFELSSLDGSNGFVLNGVGVRDISGYAASALGDFNGDNVDDIFVSASAADANGREDSGESYVIFGHAMIGHTGTIEASDLNGTNGFRIRGIRPNDFAGLALSGAGDVNADGHTDLVVGALDADPNHIDKAGQAYVVFGGSNVGVEGSLDLTSLDGSNGLTMNGTHLAGKAGGAVSGAGDVNGDGYDDFIVAAVFANPQGRNDAGQAYIVFGSANLGNPPKIALTHLDGSNGFTVDGISAFDNAGRAVGAAGDVNGDGFDDVLIGAFYADPNGKPEAGEAYLVFGHAAPFPPNLDFATLDGTNGFAMWGADVGERAGISLNGAGDVNGDGFDDIIVGAMRAQPNGIYDAGRTYVVFGGPNVGKSGIVDFAKLNGSNGFVLNGVSRDDQSGWQASGIGDINADGFDDFVIGAHEADPGARKDAGQAYVIYGGRTVGGDGMIDLSALNGEDGFTVNGIDPYDYAGMAATSGGDLNDDGIDDLVIGAFAADPNGVTRAGETYVIFGRGADSDEDGIANTLDNCTDVANTDQRDSNGDGYGNICDPDLDNNGVTNFTDLGLLKAAFFSADPDADLDGDGQVNFVDLGIMKSLFFAPPGPSGLVQ